MQVSQVSQSAMNAEQTSQEDSDSESSGSDSDSDSDSESNSDSDSDFEDPPTKIKKISL